MSYIYETPKRPIQIRIPDAPVRCNIHRVVAIGENMNSAFRKLNFSEDGYKTPEKVKENSQIPDAPKKNDNNKYYSYDTYSTPKKLNFGEPKYTPPPAPMKRQRDYPLDELVEGMPAIKRICFEKT